MKSRSPGAEALLELGLSEAELPREVAGLVTPPERRAQWQADKRAQQFLTRYRFDPTAFGTEVLQIEHNPWQRDANEAIADYVRWQYRRPLKVQRAGDVKNWFTVRSMHGPGKTFWVGSLVLWFGSVFPGARIPCVAPKLDQLKTRLWLEMKKIRAGAVADFQRMTEDIGSIHLRWFGDDTWTAFGQTATHAENLSGLHNDRLLVVVDEATGVAEALFPTIEGALSTGRIVIFVMISNPSKNTGTFAKSWLKPVVARQYWPIAVTLDKAPRVSRAWVAAMVAKYGEHSPIVRIRCYGEFADDSPLQLISTEWVAAALERECPDLSQEHTRLRVSGDIADGGDDETVVTAAREHSMGRTVLRVTRHSFPSSLAPIAAADEMELRFEQLGGRKGVDEMVVDGLGVGAGTAGTLMRRGHRVVVHKGGEQSSDPKKWRNRRVQNYMALRDAYRDGRVWFDEGCFVDDLDREELLAQLVSVQMNPNTDRVDDLVTKEQMKAQGLKSPDFADSLSMQYSAAQSAGQGLFDHVRLAAQAVEAARAQTGAAALMSEKPKKAPLSAHPAARDVPIVTTETI